MKIQKHEYIRCLECDDVISTGETCSCCGVYVDFLNNVYSVEGSRYETTVSKEQGKEATAMGKGQDR